ncbi:probable G-protein coupled receptor Mth-like 3 isoform X1 [Vanessa tameamea]|uniref:Probable G-protein coupled receptor Mth-like 3 isoform X1 n=1 Tax=Vanessa tameamea TaxID=334116 RepID=A0A8B8HSV5_VANTA|nr:probable G-protein coupled receptor Mth-like 3 isoform X1 [Vanessa tameamea]
MWSLILVFIIVFAVAGTIGALKISDDQEKLIFRKCCPRSQSLIKVSQANGTLSERYECVDRESLKKSYGIFSEPLYVSSRVVIKNGLPVDCDELQAVQINISETEILPWENDCYDRLVAEIVNGTLKQNVPKTVAVICNRSEVEILTDTKLKIYEFRKCCPRGQRFDTVYHECRDVANFPNSDEDWLVQQLNVSSGQIFEIENGLRCKLDEYAVELRDSAYLLSVEGSTLFALSRSGEKDGRFMPGEWCMDQEYGIDSIIAQVCTRNCDTFSAYCIRKCCPLGQHFKLRRCGSYVSTCVPNEDQEVLFNISTYTQPLQEDYEDLFDVVGMRIGLQCPAGRFGLNSSIPEDQHRLTRESYLETSTTLTNNYCLEVFDRRECPGNNDVIVSGVLCFLPAAQSKDFRVSFIIITISSICLALTLVVYCVLPELRNLHGRTLICHVSMMLLACSCLARVQHSAVTDYRLCTTLGYGIYFGFVAAFAWLNVMCFDIWWTFGSVRTVKPLRKSGSDRRRFIWYSIYAWSITILLTLTMFLLDRYPISTVLDANIGNGACWFGALQNTQSDWPHYIFFVVPMGLVTCTNFVLWLLTARHCAQVKSEVHRLQAGSVGDRAKRRFRIDRAKYILTGKLWVVMGAGWVSELLSTIVSEPQWLWNIVDLFNELQGVFIFLILIVKPKLYYLIRKRLVPGYSRAPIDTRLEKPDARNNATSSGRTSSTFLSRTISSDERTNLRISLPNNIKQP